LLHGYNFLGDPTRKLEMAPARINMVKPNRRTLSLKPSRLRGQKITKLARITKKAIQEKEQVRDTILQSGSPNADKEDKNTFRERREREEF